MKSSHWELNLSHWVHPSQIQYCTVCSYTNGLLSPGNKHLATQTLRFHHRIIQCYTASHTHKHPNAPYTHEQWCTHADMLSSSSTDTNRHTHRWTHTRRCSRTQNKHTQGFGVLVSICGEAILSLSGSLLHSQTHLRGGSYCGHVTHCCCCCSLCVCG